MRKTSILSWTLVIGLCSALLACEPMTPTPGTAAGSGGSGAGGAGGGGGYTIDSVRTGTARAEYGDHATGERGELSG